MPQYTSNANAVIVTDKTFTLTGKNVSYRFHVDDKTGDLRLDHFGGRISGPIPSDPYFQLERPVLSDRIRREFPDQGRGDFRIPAIRIRQSAGCTLSALEYVSHSVVKGKPSLRGLPATFGCEEDVTTLLLQLYDKYSDVAAELSYSIFPEYDAIARSVSITNAGQDNITVEDLASLSVDFTYEDLDMITLHGDWGREAFRQRRSVELGTQGFESNTGFSSHLNNPFLALGHRSTTESCGEAWGFSLVYTGSSTAKVEKNSQGMTRILLGFNPKQLSWGLGPGETLVSPECVAVYSKDGLGGMSRLVHRLYRNHLMKSKFVKEVRPVLLNSWEGLYFDIDQSKIYQMAKESSALGVQLFVMDDGWFGKEYPRVNDKVGLGDWVPDPERFPDGLGSLGKSITSLSVAGSSNNLRFGIWVEPEMVNPISTLYREHPDWALHGDPYPRVEERNQLLLNLALPEVQEFIINSISNILQSAPISYVKWDHNRSMTELSSPNAGHAHILGMYHIFNTLMTRFPDVLWEGCASGGGRFDPGVLQFFPQIWTSDNTDAIDRISIQFGTSLAYPASAMGAHLSDVPNHQTLRTTPLTFRAHVAMMGGSFGLELDPNRLLPEDKLIITDLIALSEKISPIVLNGDMWRLRLPEESNWPAMLFISEDGSRAVLFYFQLSPRVNRPAPHLKLEGLSEQSMYRIDGRGPYSGAMLMNLGLQYSFHGDYDSKVLLIEKEE